METSASSSRDCCSLGASFSGESHRTPGTSSSLATINIRSIRRAFTELFSIPELPFQSALVNGVFNMSRILDNDLRSTKFFVHRPDYVNVFIIIMEIPVLDSLEFMENVKVVETIEKQMKELKACL